jgi:predicted small integral membrane protein
MELFYMVALFALLIFLFILFLLNSLIISEYAKPVVDNTITIIQSAISKGTKSNISWTGG